MNRKEFIGGVLSAAFLPTASAETRIGDKPEYHAFSRVFQFLKDPYKAADFLKSCGYDGVEWTVRAGGFLDPTLATAERMKALKSAADKAGIKADNIVVDYLRGDDPDVERVILLAADAGFKSFRGDYFKYDRAKTHQQNFDAFRSGFDSLEALARKSGLKACYQNHSTYNKKVPLFGSLVWDLASVVKDHDPKYIGIQYDPMHVRAEGRMKIAEAKKLRSRAVQYRRIVKDGECLKNQEHMARIRFEEKVRCLVALEVEPRGTEASQSGR